MPKTLLDSLLRQEDLVQVRLRLGAVVMIVLGWLGLGEFGCAGGLRWAVSTSLVIVDL